MDSILHSHIAGMYIQERIERAQGERIRRELKPNTTHGPARFRPRLRRATQTSPAPTSSPEVGARAC